MRQTFFIVFRRETLMSEMKRSWVWKYTPIIPGLGRLKQEAKGQSQQLNKALSNLDHTVSK